MLDDLTNDESEVTSWPQLMYNVRKIGYVDVAFSKREKDRGIAIVELVSIKVQADKVMLRIKAIKISPLLSLTDEKMEVLDELAA